MIGLTQTVFVLSGVAASWASADVTAVLNQAGACLFSGFASAVLALLILPLFEGAFKVASDISLLELSDLGHPLLQRLAIEAPGTYHHSLVVANLATGAADAIGANSLLARVCAYYHDVGKLTKPDFFTENQNRRGNPHDDLAPSMSTLVITSHVKEGLSLGMRYRLPPPIMAVIHEHHGTSLLSCFHHKARQQLEFELPAENGPARVSESDFRYPGPRPSSRESAIICIADAVEAASRSLEKVTPSHIEGLVKDIVQARVADGQLDDCPLSFDELSRVRKALVFSLSSMLHGRVPYPTDESNDKQQTESGAAQPNGDSQADGTADAESHD
jgi:putative nucleotidyltransferase with HDIG domain